MNIDERLERLAARHEALAQSVELLLVTTRETGENLNKVVDLRERDAENIRKLVEVTNQDAENIRALARIAESHERRITNIDGGRA